MSDYYGNTPQDVRPGIDARRLWAGGVATAVVAALVAVVGLLIARGIFEVEVLAPKGKASGATPAPRRTQWWPPRWRCWRPG